MRKLIFPLGLVLLLCSCSSEKTDPRVQIIDDFLKGQEKFYKFNGNVLVAEKGKVIYQESFGKAQFETGALLNDSSVFELASVSKQLTAAAILLLKQQEKISLQDSLRKFFPELPYPRITIYHMLTHTSGLPDYMEVMDPKWDHKKIAFNNDMIALLAQEKPAVLFQPGAKWEYCNTAYAILASIVEKVSGQTFKDFLAQSFFEPLNMTHTRIYNTRRSGETIDNYAYGFTWSDSLNRFVLPDSVPGLEQVYFLDGIMGDGVVNSTTGDLLKWDRSLLNHIILKEELVKEMTSPQRLADSASMSYYGYGVGVGSNQFGDYIVHSGGWPGYSTNLARYTKNDLTLIVLSNNESASTAIQATLTNICHGQPITLPAEHTPTAADSMALKKFAGTFKVSTSGSKFTIEQKGNTLQLWGNELLSESDNKVFMKKYDLQIEIDHSGTTPKYYRVLFGVKEEITKE